MHIDKLDNIVNKYNNTYRTIKMKPVDVKSEVLYKKELQKNKSERVQSWKINKKVINYLLNGEAMTILLTVGLIKKKI